MHNTPLRVVYWHRARGCRKVPVSKAGRTRKCAGVTASAQPGSPRSTPPGGRWVRTVFCGSPGANSRGLNLSSACGYGERRLSCDTWKCIF